MALTTPGFLILLLTGFAPIGSGGSNQGITWPYFATLHCRNSRTAVRHKCRPHRLDALPQIHCGSEYAPHWSGIPSGCFRRCWKSCRQYGEQLHRVLVSDLTSFQPRGYGHIPAHSYAPWDDLPGECLLGLFLILVYSLCHLDSGLTPSSRPLCPGKIQGAAWVSDPGRE